MLARSLWLAVVVIGVAAPSPAHAQNTDPLLYRVFLSDGTGLASFGEWARVDDRLVFSMPLAPGAGPADLHLVSLPVQRLDMARTERYAESVRAAHYAANRGEADFAQLSGDVAHALNEVALIKEPSARLVAAERARQALAAWPGSHYGYRAAEVREIRRRARRSDLRSARAGRQGAIRPRAVDHHRGPARGAAPCSGSQ